jgi:nucleolar MIF4G domain-containing protein 1
VIQFADLEKISIKFVRQILLGLLLAKDEAASSAVFFRIPSTDQLSLFRESLKIFLHRYVLSKKHQLPAGSDTELLISRVDIAEKALTNAESRVTF